MGMFDGASTKLPDTLDSDPTMFGPDEADINFERDFGQWFNPDDFVGGPSGGGVLPGLPPPSGMGGPTDMGMFDGAFMNLPDTLDFDPTTMFRPDGGDLNFERDFGQWFNPDDVGAGLDGMK